MDLGIAQKYAVNRPEITVDSLDILCGKYIGSGSNRDVFECNLNKNLVVKIEKPDSDSHENIIEWKIWNLVAYTDYDKWFARCAWLSRNGKILLMEKTRPKPNKERPEMIPDFFSDIKDSNWGWIGNQFTCHDYATTLIRFQYRGLTNKMQKYTP